MLKPRRRSRSLGEVRMEHVAPEIRQLAKLVTDHATETWLEVYGGVWVRRELVVAIEPVNEPVVCALRIWKPAPAGVLELVAVERPVN